MQPESPKRRQRTATSPSSNTLLQRVSNLEAELNELRRQNAYLESLTLTDSLTGLRNRRYLVEFLERERAQSERYHTPLSLLLVNIDHLSRYNQNFGHTAGDALIQQVVATLLGQIRTTDLVTRYSAELFAIALPCTDAQGARHLGERLCSAVQKLHAPPAQVTVSIGVSTLPQYGGTTASLTYEAEAALHTAQKQGRNRAIHCEDVPQRNTTPLPNEVLAVVRTSKRDASEPILHDLIPVYETTIHGWLRVLEMKDAETEGHSERVTAMTLRLARHIGVEEDNLLAVRWGALLHDIGKMGVPDTILQKPGALTPEEWVIMKMHPVYAYEMLLPIPFLKPTLAIPYCHHERWDGSGYPRGLSGEEIPFVARIFSVIDVWDALCSDRPYRAAWSQTRAMEYICSQAGQQFDPEIVRAFVELYELKDPLLCNPQGILTHSSYA
jgi:diguanylate cyclase (GGDEF)-like protein/putative nucleotidyltransferase with HDIG domain